MHTMSPSSQQLDWQLLETSRYSVHLVYNLGKKEGLEMEEIRGFSSNEQVLQASVWGQEARKKLLGIF